MGNSDWVQNDFYAILGVKRDATELEIKKAYRALALRHHPDANNGDERAAERFKSVAQAFQVLSRPAERSRYDRLRAILPNGAFRPNGFQKYTAGPSPYRHVPRPPAKGEDLQTRVVLSEKEARKGITVPIEVNQYGKMPRTVIVRVPPGVVDGQSWRIPKRGGSGLHGGDPGDLWVTARVFSSEVLNRFPDLNEARAGRDRKPFKLRDVPKAARMLAHFLLYPNDVELNEALSRFADASTATWADEIIRSRRAARR